MFRATEGGASSLSVDMLTVFSATPSWTLGVLGWLGMLGMLPSSRTGALGSCRVWHGWSWRHTCCRGWGRVQNYSEAPNGEDVASTDSLVQTFLRKATNLPAILVSSAVAARVQSSRTWLKLILTTILIFTTEKLILQTSSKLQCVWQIHRNKTIYF